VHHRICVALAEISAVLVTPGLLPRHQDLGAFVSQDAKQATSGFFQHFDAHLVLAGAHAQQGLVHGILYGFTLGFDFVCHVVCRPPS
jgi:hypothetical protein